MSTVVIPPLSGWRRWVPGWPVLAAWGITIGLLGWTYASTFNMLIHNWWRMPDYQHGFLVPVFSGFLLWIRQDMVDPWPSKGSWWGLPFFGAWVLMRAVNSMLNYDRDIDSIYPLLIGLALFLGGWRALRWAWPAIVFLVFMVPLPMFLSVMLSRPLQRIATVSSVYTLQTLGISAIVPGDQGTVIQLPPPCTPLDIERACSGLSMLTLFFAICVGAVFVLRVPWWEKVIILVSAVPIAVFSNVARITITGVLGVLINSQTGQRFHDWAGWVMMIIALLMIWGEMSLISWLLLEAPTDQPLALGGLRGAAAAPGNARPTPRPVEAAGGGPRGGAGRWRGPHPAARSG